MPRVLFLCSSEPDIVSGTPVIVSDMLTHFLPDDAELISERRYHITKRRKFELPHRVWRLRFPNCLWPLRRGSRVRELLAPLALPWLVLFGCWRVRRLRPACLLAIYWRVTWILSAYLISKLTGVPLVFYVHDTVRENYDRLGGLSKRFVAWLEPKVLRHARVLVLHPYLADHYHERYGIDCTILRQVVRGQPRANTPPGGAGEMLTIGFSGAIYDNNAQQLADLAAIVASRPGLRLKIWSDAAAARLDGLGIAGDRIERGFESDYARLLAQISECDLLYLPLAFADSGQLTTDALQYAFPTKSLDYLLAGPPILVHCPSNYELSRFFSGHKCAHVLNEGSPAALSNFIDSWLSGRMTHPSAAAKRSALEQFSPQENRRLLRQVISELSVLGLCICRLLSDSSLF